jgi:predicted lipid-binding transport protein (Tim44 family)
MDVARSDTEELQTTSLPIPEQPTAPAEPRPAVARSAEPTERAEPVEPPIAVQQPARVRRWRGLTGSLAVGLAVLAVVVLGAGVFGLFTGAPGPGVASLVAHPVAAVLALVAQYFADRRRGRVAGFAALAIVAIAVATLWFFWWI